MKLVLATPLYPPEPGGPATYARILKEGLPARGIEVEIVKFSDVRHLPKLIRHFAYYRRLLKAGRNADAILALDPVSVGLPAMLASKKLKKPFVVKIVGDYAWEQGRQRFGVTQELDEFLTTRQTSIVVRMLQKIQRSIATSAAKIIVPSDYLKEIVASWGISESTITRIYNGIDIPPNLLSPDRSKGFLVVSSGRRVPWKGFEAIEKVVSSHPNWHFFLAAGLSREEALGWVRAADVFVLNSTYEGFPHALIEAMTLGTPVIATNNRGNRNLLNDQETGLLVQVGNEDELSKALESVAADPVAARKRAEAAKMRMGEFAPSHMLEATATLLTSL